MNTTNTRHIATTLATATAVAAALTTVFAIAPTAASAQLPDPIPGPVTHCGESVSSADTVDIALLIAQRKAQLALQAAR